MSEPETTADLDERLAEIDRVHAMIPDALCKGLCGESCVRVLFSPAELSRLPVAYPNPQNMQEVRERCPLLSEQGSCSVYELRPMVCHVWAAADALRCPHGCGPADGVFLSDADAVAFLLWTQMLGDPAYGIPVGQVEGVVERMRVLLAHPLLAGPVHRMLDKTGTQIDNWLMREAMTDVRDGRPLGRCRSRMAKRMRLVERYGDPEAEQRAVLAPFLGSTVANEREAMELQERIARELLAVDERPVPARGRTGSRGGRR